jgi:hypothetical protein
MLIIHMLLVIRIKKFSKFKDKSKRFIIIVPKFFQAHSAVDKKATVRSGKLSNIETGRWFNPTRIKLLYFQKIMIGKKNFDS